MQHGAKDFTLHVLDRTDAQQGRRHERSVAWGGHFMQDAALGAGSVDVG